MACFMPFNNRNLDVNFIVLKAKVVNVDELLDTLKHFSLWTQTLGCIHSSILQSIHGNMILWYGAWMKRSAENKDLLNAALMSMLANVSSMAMVMDNSFFDTYAGESRDGSPAARFSTGDTISISVVTHSRDQLKVNDLSYALLATFKSRFLKMEGATSGVCLKRCGNKNDNPIQDLVLNFFVWQSIHSCYSYILNSDVKSVIIPYLKGLSLDIKYDMFKVVYVSGDNVSGLQYYPHQMLQGSEDVQINEIVQDY